MFSDASRFAKACPECAITTAAGRRIKPPLHPIQVGRPFQILGIDIMDLPLTDSGHRHVVVIQDLFTKWPFIFPVADQRTNRIARLIAEEVVPWFGVPEALLSDRGANLLSHLVLDLCRRTQQPNASPKLKCLTIDRKILKRRFSQPPQLRAQDRGCLVGGVPRQLDHIVLPIPEPPGTIASNIPPTYSGIGPNDTSIVVECLSPNTNHSISLFAYTSSGCSNVSTAINQTKEDGNESVTYANGVRYMNARLESGSDYSFFVRIDLRSDTGEALRIRTNFTNLFTRDEIADNNAAGAAAGGVIVTLVTIAAACAIILLIFFILRRKHRSQKLDIRQEVALEDMASSKNPVTAISSHVIANPLAAPHRRTFEPIPVRNFAAHVVHLHSNDDFLFAEEYSSVEPDHAPMSEVCLRPENQSKNRYANIKA
ncbi:Receptor-type tyrosine-protein phosphatase delta [Geodia barretti]|uniref:Receptor-type tyrosine-protein phosphatase delta n=1 Tax=Geodia barretti TaxID=519541 RepID=A0AA35SDV5_GEOBA|nr:Receptor-type tyrosine-protein phosphatase delta [Geodia barretti]